MSKKNAAKVIVWNKKELRIQGRRTKTQEALVMVGGKYNVVVYRTLKDNVANGEKAFTVRLVNMEKQKDVKRVTRNTLELAKRAAARWLSRRVDMQVSA